MNVSVEISMYPLIEEYPQIVQEFIEKLQTQKDLIVTANAMSTEIYGDYEIIFDLLKNNISQEFDNGKAVFVLKISNGC